MIQKLLISNYALIEHLEIEIHQGLTTVTGETGAGKSILLGAIGLLLGNRADTSVITEGKNKCVIEGYFDVQKLQLESLFAREELDYHPLCIIRREIANNGKSRSFINDTPVNLQVLKELGLFLVEIQTQHTNLLMAQPEVQRNLLDSFSDSPSILIEFRKSFEALTKLKSDLRAAEVQYQKAVKEKDYLEFQRNEIGALFLSEGEEITLEQEISTLSQAQEIRDSFQKATSGLIGAEWNVRNLLQQVLSTTKAYENLGESFKQFNDRLKSLIIESSDLGEEAQRFSEKFEPNEVQLFEKNERLHKIQQLLRKHQFGTCKELISLEEELSHQLISTDSLEQDISRLKTEIKNTVVLCESQAKAISELRSNAAKKIETEALSILKRLNMPHAQIQFKIDFDLSRLHLDGADFIELLFSSNLGVPMQKASQIASGGELSRLNFAFRSLISKKKLLPTLIYDEADTGISGEVAAKMGELFREMGAYHQVLCISHLPQIAAAGNQQWEIRKFEGRESTKSEVTLLDETERIESIAKMLSGAEITPTAKSNAQELLLFYKGFKFS